MTSHAARMILRRDLHLTWPTVNHTWVSLQPFQLSVLSNHAVAMAAAFEASDDLIHYPSLGTETGCRDLLHDMVGLAGFCPAATWLAVERSSTGLTPPSHEIPVGTITAMINPVTGIGEIQNVGVVPSHRRRGIAAMLLAKCLDGFRAVGVDLVSLEVSATNHPALRLYRNFGFRPYKTVYAPIRKPDVGAGI